MLKAKESEKIIERIQSRDVVLSRYSPIFQNKNIENLTRDKFSDILKLRNSKIVAGLDTYVDAMTADMENLISSLKLLTDESKDLATRFRESVDMVNGMGPTVASAILHVSNPEKYGVWNGISKQGLEILELWPTGTRDDGRIYVEVNNVLNVIKDEIGVDLWTLDAIWYYFTNEALRDRIATGLQKESDYSVPKEHKVLQDIINLVVSGYRDVLEDLIDESDLHTVLYTLTDANYSKKIDVINGSNLPTEIKNEIQQHLNRVHNSNEVEKIGLLSEQDIKINASKDVQSDFAKKIIKLSVKLIDIEDDNKLFSIVEEDIIGNIRKIQAPIVSYILHFLKPRVFPIFHGYNFKKLLKYLNSKLKNIDSSDNYIDNSKIIREYRDNYCKFNNY